MKRLSRYFMFLGLALFLSIGPTSCKTGEGCNTSSYTAKTDKDGNLSMKRGKSNLFSKKKRKR